MIKSNIILTNKVCVACEGDVPPFTQSDIDALYPQLNPDWKVSEDIKHISRHFVFDTFAQALAFVNQVGALAEAEGHHPDIRFGWGYCDIDLTTHAINGLSENDFIMAAKIDKLG